MRRMRSPLLTIAVLPLAACVTWTQIPVDRIPDEVGPRDIVRLETGEGRELVFAVTAVEPTALVGDDVRVELRRIQWLMRRDFDSRRFRRTLGQVGLVVAVVVVGVVFFGMASAFSEGDVGRPYGTRERP